MNIGATLLFLAVGIFFVARHLVRPQEDRGSPWLEWGNRGGLAVDFGAGVLQSVSKIEQTLPLPQLENAILLALGAVFLIAFFLANDHSPGSGSPTR
jgi:hypothetical protein